LAARRRACASRAKQLSSRLRGERGELEHEPLDAAVGGDARPSLQRGAVLPASAVGSLGDACEQEPPPSDGAQADSVHAPTDATRVFERTGYQLSSMDEQLAFADRRKKRDAATIGSGAMLPSTDPRAAGGQSPQSSTHAPELRGDRGFGKRREGAELRIRLAGRRWISGRVENGDCCEAEKLFRLLPER